MRYHTRCITEAVTHLQFGEAAGVLVKEAKPVCCCGQGQQQNFS